MDFNKFIKAIFGLQLAATPVLGKQTNHPSLAEAEAVGFFHGRWGKDIQEIKSIISPTTCQLWVRKLL